MRVRLDDAAHDLPVAHGHRFGWDLVCSQCGAIWDDHRASPESCGPAPRCKHGHEMTGDNVYLHPRPDGKMQEDCRACARASDRRHRDARRMRERKRLERRRKRAARESEGTE